MEEISKPFGDYGFDAHTFLRAAHTHTDGSAKIRSLGKEIVEHREKGKISKALSLVGIAVTTSILTGGLTE